jgi:Family of unknown function (DUF6308)
VLRHLSLLFSSSTLQGVGKVVTYGGEVTGSSLRPVVLRNGVRIDDPMRVVLGFLEAYGHLEVKDPSPAASFGEQDLRLANRGGARISATEIAAILERRRAIERGLRAIAPAASLAGTANAVPWVPLRQLFDAFGDIRGVGFSKMTKALHRKRPGLIPILDSVVQKYLEDDDLGAKAAFGERALGFVRGYKRDLDRNRAAVRAVRQELARRGHALTEVRILDLLIWSVGASSPELRSQPKVKT